MPPEKTSKPQSEGSPRAWAIAVAAGEGKRFRHGAFASGPRKPFVELAGRPVLLRTLDALARARSVERIVVAVAADDLAAARALIEPERERLRVAAVVAGGERRQDSVARALDAIPEDVALVAVHDGARPLVTPELVDQAIEAAARTGAACVAMPVRDTLKRVDDSEIASTIRATVVQPTTIRATVEREGLWSVQTPQVFGAGELRQALAQAAREGVEVTDDAQLFDRAGVAVEAVRGSPRNIKITTPEDLEMAEALIAAGEGRTGDVRVGSGFDVHPLAPKRRLVVCGVELASDLGGEGHSDADAAAHAVIDALLGACALGDVGALFPDTDPAYKDADSMKLLADATARIREAGFVPGSLDVTVFLARPKLGPHADRMRRNLAEAVGVPVERVSVKAKTMNGLGPVGEGTAYAAQATAVVRQRPDARHKTAAGA